MTSYWWLVLFAVSFVMAVTQLVAICWNQMHNDTIHEGCTVGALQFTLSVAFVMLTVWALRHYWLLS